MKEKSQNPEADYSVKDLKIQDLVPNTFYNVIVAISDGRHILDMPPNMIGLSFKNWLKTPGGIFSKDVLKYTRHKPHGKYVLYVGETRKFVARLIEGDELLLFESLNLIDGYFKDKPYMILKDITDNNLTNNKRYIEETIEDIVDEEEEELVRTEPNMDEVVDYEGTSISLFD